MRCVPSPEPQVHRCNFTGVGVKSEPKAIPHLAELMLITGGSGRTRQADQPAVQALRVGANCAAQGPCGRSHLP